MTMTVRSKTVFEGVCAMMVSVLNLMDPIRIEPTSSFVVDFGADSLDTVELAMAIEDHFEIEVEDADWEGVLYVGQAVAVVDKYLKAAGRDLPIGADLSGVEGVQPRKQTDWQVGHTEHQGKTFVVYDLAQQDDDAGACTLSVKGRGAKEIAERVAKFLQAEGL
jgi:acyl carrier protein